MEQAIKEEIAESKARFQALIAEKERTKPEIMKMIGSDTLELLSDGKNCESIYNEIPKKKIIHGSEEQTDTSNIIQDFFDLCKLIEEQKKQLSRALDFRRSR